MTTIRANFRSKEGGNVDQQVPKAPRDPLNENVTYTEIRSSF